MVLQPPHAVVLTAIGYAEAAAGPGEIELPHGRKGRVGDSMMFHPNEAHLL
ncbi:MAG: hypothetical protein P8O79_10905 [Halieaceae bacterium]|nr:hypothetical protein [Halieaceae bacterium]